MLKEYTKRSCAVTSSGRTFCNNSVRCDENGCNGKRDATRLEKNDLSVDGGDRVKKACFIDEHGRSKCGTIPKCDRFGNCLLYFD